MKTIYFDDLFLIMHNDGYTLCEYVPYEQHKELLTIGLGQEFSTPEHLIYLIIQSEAFTKLRLEVLGVSHKLSNAK